MPFDYNRLSLLSAVLEKRLGINLSSSDIFLNIVGGLRVGVNMDVQDENNVSVRMTKRAEDFLKEYDGVMIALREQ